MGQAVSRVRGAIFTRPLQHYNVEARAEKALKRQLAAAERAPRFESDQQALDQLRRTHPETAEAVKKKDEGLYSMLKQASTAAPCPSSPSTVDLKATVFFSAAKVLMEKK